MNPAAIYPCGAESHDRETPAVARTTGLDSHMRYLARIFGLAFAAVVLAWSVSVDAQNVKQVAIGRALFQGKANCSVCHTIGRITEDKRARGPDLAGIGKRASERAKQFGLRNPDAATRYLVRSIIRPEADVVKGYNPAPESWLASGLSDDEIRSLVVYLQSLGSKPRADQISLPAEFLKTKRQEYQRELALFAFGDPKRGQKLFHDIKSKAACANCHKIDNRGEDICPDLSTVNRVQRPGYIFGSILDSSKFIVRGYQQIIILDDDGEIHTGLPIKEDDKTITLVIDQKGKTEVVQKDAIDVKKLSEVSQMPGNFSEVLTAKQMIDIVAYLLKHEEFSAAKTNETKPHGTGVLLAPSINVFEPLTDGQKRYRQAMERGDPVIGKRIYTHYCVMCHGSKGEGNGFNAVNLTTKPANHTDDRRMSRTEDLLLQGVITRGGMKTGRSFLMPPWGNVLTDRQRWDLVAYLRTLHSKMRSTTPHAKTTLLHGKATGNVSDNKSSPLRKRPRQQSIRAKPTISFMKIIFLQVLSFITVINILMRGI